MLVKGRSGLCMLAFWLWRSSLAPVRMWKSKEKKVSRCFSKHLPAKNGLFPIITWRRTVYGIFSDLSKKPGRKKEAAKLEIIQCRDWQCFLAASQSDPAPSLLSPANGSPTKALSILPQHSTGRALWCWMCDADVMLMCEATALWPPSEGFTRLDPLWGPQVIDPWYNGASGTHIHLFLLYLI